MRYNNDIKTGDMYYFTVGSRRKTIFILWANKEKGRFMTLSDEPNFTPPRGGWDLRIANKMWQLEEYKREILK